MHHVRLFLVIVDFKSLFNTRFPSSLQTCQLRFQVRKLGTNFATKFANSFQFLLPPPGGYVITGFVCVCVCVCVCMCLCVCVCLFVSTITQEIPNIFIRNFLNAFPIGQGRID